jgi:hypothetical protein
MKKEKRYTLQEARIELYRLDCEREGHSYTIVVVDGSNEPEELRCLRCGRIWSVTR